MLTYRATDSEPPLTARARDAADAFRKSLAAPEGTFRFVAADLMAIAAQLGAPVEEAQFGMVRVKSEGAPPVVLELEEGTSNIQAVCGGCMLQLGGCMGYDKMEEDRGIVLRFSDDLKAEVASRELLVDASVTNY